MSQNYFQQAAENLTDMVGAVAHTIKDSPKLLVATALSLAVLTQSCASQKNGCSGWGSNGGGVSKFKK
ncbi:MAG: hypothetical protein JWM96_274 [Alphaproteobacteria bacterium]|nr:hypothetical protein [Alphaproteobacteria bacterium]